MRRCSQRLSSEIAAVLGEDLEDPYAQVSTSLRVQAEEVRAAIGSYGSELAVEDYGLGRECRHGLGDRGKRSVKSLPFLE
jgi:hypothetical protein